MANPRVASAERSLKHTLRKNSFPGLKTHHTEHGHVHRNQQWAQQPTRQKCVVSTTSSPNKQDSRRGRARTFGETTTPTVSCPLQAAMTWSCLGTGWRGFSAHMSCMVTRVPLVRKMSPKKRDERHLSCLTACGHRTTCEGHHCTSTNDTVVSSRYSTVYYQTSPTKTDGVSESVRCVHEHVLGDTRSQTCPPVLAQRCAPYELASDLERRTGVRHQRFPETLRQPEKDE